MKKLLNLTINQRQYDIMTAKFDAKLKKLISTMTQDTYKQIAINKINDCKKYTKSQIKSKYDSQTQNTLLTNMQYDYDMHIDTIKNSNSINDVAIRVLNFSDLMYSIRHNLNQ